MSSLPRSRPRATLRAVDNVTLSTLKSLFFCGPTDSRFATHLTVERSADRQMTSPFSNVAMTSCVVSLLELPPATGSDSIVDICDPFEGVYEVFSISALSPRMVSWKQTNCDLAPAVDSVTEA